MKGFDCPATVIEFNTAGNPALGALEILKLTSLAKRADVEFPTGITSKHASSLHSKGATTTSSTVIVRAESAEKVAVNEISLPLAGNTTPTKVYEGAVILETGIVAVPSPVKTKFPVAGGS